MNKKILITGASGLVGKHLQKLLPEAIHLSSKDCNLLNLNETCDFFNKVKPKIVIHLAAKVGGILDNIKNPVDFFEENIVINTNTLKATYTCGSPKFIGHPRATDFSK